MAHILLVEDSPDSKELVVVALGPTSQIAWASSLAEAFKCLGEEPYDMVLLDVDLPDGDGFRFFSHLLNDHRHKDTPVIFLTAKDTLSDKVLGFSLGADDYIVKPFQPQELRARIEMRLKKTLAKQNQAQVIAAGRLEINLAAQRAFLVSQGEKADLQLTPSEFKVLTLLAMNEDRVYSRDQLMDKVWGSGTYITDRSVDTHIYSLRKKLGEFAGYIQAIYGEGYRFSLNFQSAPVAEQTRPGKKPRRGA